MGNFFRGTLLETKSKDIAALLMLAIVVVAVFNLFIFDAWTLVGDSDRLNAFMSIRKFEVDAIREYCYVSAWNERIFMGTNMAGLHYMLPGVGVFAYLEALLPEPYLFRAMTFVSMTLVVIAGWAAYAFIKEICGEVLPAFTGAVLYCVSVYALHRVAQLDSSFGVLIHIPLVMLLIRRITAQNVAMTFVGLAALICSLFVFTFLQEAAYAIVLFGAYACYRAYRGRTALPITVLSLATAAATTIAFPRVFTVYQDFLQLDRTKDFPQTSWIEVYRFFSEGIFGRFQGEGQSIKNGTNLHEGLQLVGSTFAAFLIVAGAFFSPSPRERWVALVLIAILSMVIGAPLYELYGWLKPSGSFPTVEATIIAINAVILAAYWIFRESAKTKHGLRYAIFIESSRNRDESIFHLVLLCVVLSVVLITEVRYLFYFAFMKVDFTHARFSIAALLPLCTLVAIYLHRLMGHVEQSVSKQPSVTALISTLALAALVVGIVEGPVFETWLTIFGLTRPIKIAWNHALPLEFWRMILMLGMTAVLLWVLGKHTISPAVKQSFGLAFCFLIVFESVAYAEFKLAGPHTRYHSAPFEKNNYMNVPPGVLVPPTQQQAEALREKIQNDEYRSVLIAPPSKFPAFVAPHVANFWQLRLVDGYSAGVPERLASFEWPGDVRTLRALSFGSAAHIPWVLLGLLNVKYAIFVDQSLYYNVGREVSGQSGEGVASGVRFIVNPYNPLPRHFFVEKVYPGKLGLTEPSDPSRMSPPKGVVATALDDGGVWLIWSARWLKDVSFVVEGAEVKGDNKNVLALDFLSVNFSPLGTVGAGGRSFFHPKLGADRRWLFRVKSCVKTSCSEYSAIAEVVTAVPGSQPPDGITLKRAGSDAIRMSWVRVSPSAFYRVERQRSVDESFSDVTATTPGEAGVTLKFHKNDINDVLRVRACDSKGCSPHSEAVAIASALGEGERGSVRVKEPLSLPLDLRKGSFAEGFPAAKSFSTEGAVNVDYKGDRIIVRVDPVVRERFLVLNELYHPAWQAFAGSRRLEVFPTNTVMRGIVIPPGVALVKLQFVPVLYRWQSIVTMVFGFVLVAFIWLILRRQR